MRAVSCGRLAPTPSPRVFSRRHAPGARLALAGLAPGARRCLLSLTHSLTHSRAFPSLAARIIPTRCALARGLAASADLWRSRAPIFLGGAASDWLLLRQTPYSTSATNDAQGAVGGRTARGARGVPAAISAGRRLTASSRPFRSCPIPRTARHCSSTASAPRRWAGWRWPVSRTVRLALAPADRMTSPCMSRR